MCELRITDELETELRRKHPQLAARMRRRRIQNERARAAAAARARKLRSQLEQRINAGPETREAPSPAKVVRWTPGLFVFFLLWLTLDAQLSAHASTNNPSLEPTSTEPAHSINEAQAGSLLLRNDQGRAQWAVLESTHVNFQVFGISARARVTQRFQNTSLEYLQATYVFPLPTDAAVDSLQMRIGERLIVGEIREKQQARRDYEQARKLGKQAALVEQTRPNLFTQKIANIAPQQTVEIVIQYQQVLNWDNGRFSLRFPTTITPRYQSVIPAGVQRDAALPVSSIAPASRFSIQAHIDAGAPIAQIYSPTHNVSSQCQPSTCDLSLDGSNVKLDRDLELHWTLAASENPQPALFSEQKGNEQYALMMLYPPLGDAQQGGMSMGRDMTFVIDTSGSMGGVSIRQARKALVLALDRLGPQDRFNIVEFNSQASTLYRQLETAHRHRVAEAQSWVRRLQAGGGTEMASAIKLALQPSKTEDEPERLHQVIFITDGAIGNETQLFDLIQKRLGNARLFTVGIGSAPNAYFMTRAAEFGRGTYSFINQAEQISERMGLLFRKLETPSLINVDLTLSNGKTQRLRDLYLGEPLIAHLKLDGGQANAVQLQGRLGNQPWSQKIAVPNHQRQSGIARLWARQEIHQLMNRGVTEGRDAVKDAITKLGLEFHLVTRHTSLIAIDKTPVRPTQAKQINNRIGNPPAKGQRRSAFPQTATSFQWQLLTGLVLIALGLLSQFLSSRWLFNKHQRPDLVAGLH